MRVNKKYFLLFGITVFLVVTLLITSLAVATPAELFLELGETLVVKAYPGVGQLIQATQILEAISTGGASAVVKIGGTVALSTIKDIGLTKALGTEAASTVSQVEEYINTGASMLNDIQVDRNTGEVKQGTVEIKTAEDTKNIEFTNVEFKFDKENEISTYTFDEKSSLSIKSKDPQTEEEKTLSYQNIQKDGVIKLDKNGDVIKADITSSKDGAAFIFDNELYEVPKGERLIYDKEAGVTMVKGDNIKVTLQDSAYKIKSLNLENGAVIRKTKEGLIEIDGVYETTLNNKNIKVEGSSIILKDNEAVILTRAGSKITGTFGEIIAVEEETKVFFDKQDISDLEGNVVSHLDRTFLVKGNVKTNEFEYDNGIIISPRDKVVKRVRGDVPQLNYHEDATIASFYNPNTKRTETISLTREEIYQIKEANEGKWKTQAQQGAMEESVRIAKLGEKAAEKIHGAEITPFYSTHLDKIEYQHEKGLYDTSYKGNEFDMTESVIEKRYKLSWGGKTVSGTEDGLSYEEAKRYSQNMFGGEAELLEISNEAELQEGTGRLAGEIIKLPEEEKITSSIKSLEKIEISTKSKFFLERNKGYAGGPEIGAITVAEATGEIGVAAEIATKTSPEKIAERFYEVAQGRNIDQKKVFARQALRAYYERSDIPEVKTLYKEAIDILKSE